MFIVCSAFINNIDINITKFEWSLNNNFYPELFALYRQTCSLISRIKNNENVIGTRK